MQLRPRWLYHVTDDYHGSVMEVIRRHPEYMAEEEPEVPRLCVSPTVAGCFAAGFFRDVDCHVYRTCKKRKGISPRGVWDSFITEERWLIPPDYLEHVGVVEAMDVYLIQELFRRYHEVTGNRCNPRLRLAQLIHAWDIVFRTIFLSGWIVRLGRSWGLWIRRFTWRDCWNEPRDIDW